MYAAKPASHLDLHYDHNNTAVSSDTNYIRHPRKQLATEKPSLVTESCKTARESIAVKDQVIESKSVQLQPDDAKDIAQILKM